MVGMAGCAAASRSVRGVLAALLALLLPLVAAPREAAAQAIRTWNVTTGTWSAGANWLSGTAPTSSDTAYFSSSTVGGSDVLALVNASTGFAGLSFNNAGTTTLRSNAGTTRTGTLGTGGITVANGAGTVTIGSATAAINLLLNGTQTWRNDSGNLLSVLGTVSTVIGSQVTIEGSGPTTISGIVSGATGRVISMTKQGTGVLTLSGLNSFTGGFTLTSGTVIMGSNQSFGGATSLLTIAGGAIDTTAGRGTVNYVQSWTGDFEFIGSGTLSLGAGRVTLGGAGSNRTVTVTSSTLMIGGTIGGAGYGLTKAGAGVLMLTGTNTFSGGLTLSQGGLTLGNNLALGTGTFTVAGGVIDVTAARTTTNNNAQSWTGDFTFAGSSTLNTGTGAVTLGGAAGSRQVTVSGSALTVGGGIGDGGLGYGLTKAGPGLMILSGSSSYTGPTTVSGGTLQVGSAAAGGIWSSGTISIASGAVVNFSRTDDYGGAYASRITGDGAVRLSSGAITLAGDSDYAGGTTLATGTVRYDSATALGTGTVSVTGVATLRAGVSGTLGNAVAMAAATTFDTNGLATGFSGPVSGVGAPTITGSGTVALSGVNTFTGNTTINGGSRLVIGGAGQLLGTTGTYAGTISGTGVLEYASSASSALSGVISGSTSVIKGGSGGLTLSGNNTFTGGFTLASGTVIVGNNGAFGPISNLLTIAGGFLDTTPSVTAVAANLPQAWTGDFTFVGAGGSFSLGTGTVTLGGSRIVTVTSSTLTVGGAIGESGSGYSLTKQGAGALVLTGVNTYTGGVTHSAGTLVFGGDSALGAAGGSFTMADGVSLDVTSNAGRILTNPVQTWNGSFSFLGANTLSLGTNSVTLVGSSTVTVVSNTLTVGGGIGDGGNPRSLTKAGAGTLVLSGSNTFTGGVTLASGLLRLGSDQALGGPGGVFTITGGTFDATAARTITNNNPQAWNGDVSFAGSAALNLGSGSVSLGTSPVVTVNASTLTVGGAIGDGGAGRGLTKAGVGTLVLGGANTFSGGVTLSTGTLSLGADAALGTGTFTIAGGAITATAPRATTNNNAQNWSGDFAFFGTSPLDLGTGPVTLAGAGSARTVTVSSGTLAVGGAISGGYGITKAGTGTLVLNGASTYTGTTTIEAGALEAGDANAFNATGPIVFAGGRLQYGAGAASVNFGPLIRGNAAAIVLDLNGQNVSLSGIDATNTGGLSWTGTTSALTLAGTNFYSGGTTLGTNQRLNVNSAGALGTGSLILGGNGTIDNTSGGLLSIGNTVAASGGSLTFGGAGAPLALTGTFFMSGANRGVTVSGGTMSLAAIDADTTARAFNFTGPGTLVLTAASGTTFQGGFNHGNAGPGGTLVISSTGAIGTGPLTLNATGGTGVLQADIDLSGAQSLANAVVLAAATNFTVSGTNNITLAGGFTSSGGNRQLTNSLVEGKSLVVSGTTFLRNASDGTGRILTLAGSGETVFSGPIVNGGTAGPGGLSITDGRVTLSASNSYTGATTFSSGTLTIGSDSALGSGGTFTISGGALASSGSYTITNPLGAFSTSVPMRYVGPGALFLTGTMVANVPTYLPGKVFEVTSGTLGMGGIAVGGSTRAYTKNGDGTLVLSGVSQAGQFSLEGGVARLSGAGMFTGADPTYSYMQVVTGTADYAGLSRSERYILMGGGNASGAFPGGRAAILTGSGTLTVFQSEAGNGIVLRSGSATGLIAGNVLLTNGTSEVYVTTSEVSQAEADLTITANIIASSTAGAPVRFIKAGVGTLAVSGSVSALSTLIGGGILRVDAAQALAAGLLQISNGQLGLNTSGTFDRSLGTGSNQVQILKGGFAAYGGVTRYVNFGGSGATATWGSSGFITTAGASFELGAADGDGTVEFQNGIDLGVALVDREFLVVRGTGTAIDARLTGVITSNLPNKGIVKLGDGILELAAANTLTGTTTVSNGILRLSNNLALQNSPLNTSGTGRIELSGVTALTFGGLVGPTDLATEFTSGYENVSSLTLNVRSGNAQIYTGAIGNGAAGMSLTKTGSGMQILSGANTYSGSTTVLSGTLQLGVGPGSGLSGDISNAGSLVLLQGGSTAGVVSGLISGTGAVGVGGGTVSFGNTANSYSGRTTIQSGVLEVGVLANTGVASSLGAATAGNARIDLGSGTSVGTLRYTGVGASTDRPIYLAGSAGGGGTLDASGSGPVSFTGGVTGVAGTTLTLAGSNTGNNYITAVTGSNVVKTGVGTWVFGTNSFTGRLSIEQGTIIASGNAPGGSGTSSSLGKENGPIPLIGLADASGTAALLAANGVTISRVVEVAALGSGDQEVVLGGSGAGTATFDANSAFRLGRGVTLAADAGGNARFLTPTANWQQQDGSADPAVAVTIGTPAATGTVTLETALPNSITAVTVRQGTLRLGNGSTVGSLGPASVLTGSAGATLAFDRSDTINSGVDFAATIGGAMNVTQLGSGTVVLAGVNSYTGTTSVAAGTMRVSGSGRIASSARIDVGAAGTLAFARADDYGGAYDGKLTGSGLLSVQSGSLTLTGLNTFAGSSEVLSGAVLQLDGQINNATLDIDSGATLMGSGTILGTTTIAGLHRPGNSPGIQTLQNLSYLSGASVEWELWSNTILNNVTPPDYDQVMLSGNLDFAGATAFNLVFTGSSGPSNFSEVEWANAFWDEDREWLVYDVAGTTTGFGNLSLVQTNWQDSTGMLFNNIRSMASFRLEKRVSNDVYLVYSSIPEPSSLALAGIGLAAAAWTARRRRR
jgi:autotransporter-associated beta strand protein